MLTVGATAVGYTVGAAMTLVASGAAIVVVCAGTLMATLGQVGDDALAVGAV